MTDHIIDSAEETVASFPFAYDLRIVLCLVPCQVFLAREATFGRLRATFVATEKRFRMSFVVFAEVTTSIER